VTVLGTFIGGLSVVRYGIPKPLIISSILLAFTNLFFLLLESMGPNIQILILTISADNFALGFSGSIFIAFLSSLTNRNYAASQYALFTSIMFLLGIILSGFSGQLVDNYGWSNFFLLAAFMGIPSILFSFIIVRKGWQEQD
jgi:PAT family beta-lactamase induction signal transducer AmpG